MYGMHLQITTTTRLPRRFTPRNEDQGRILHVCRIIVTKINFGTELRQCIF